MTKRPLALRFLDGVERIGDKLPDPVFIFVWLILALALGLRYVDWKRFSATTADGEPATLRDVRRYAAMLVGTWSAQPEEDVAIRLTLVEGGDFTWAVTTNGQTQSIEGRAGFDEAEKVLALFQQQGPPLAGKVTLDPATPGEFGFLPPGAPEEAKLVFKKS